MYSINSNIYLQTIIFVLFNKYTTLVLQIGTQTNTALLVCKRFLASL